MTSPKPKLIVVESDDEWQNGPKESDYGKELGTSFGWADRMFYGWRDGKVFDYGDYVSRDLLEMMSKDYKARQIENVLSLPIQSATWSITPAKGDSGEAEWLNEFWERDPLNGGCSTPLQYIINQMTSAFTYKKTFFEKVWDRDPLTPAGKAPRVIYRDVAFRPQTTCRLMRDARNGKMRGFEQEAYFQPIELNSRDIWPVQIEARNAFVHINGTRLDPINGTSDLEIAYWAWKTKQKILFLWFQFLEGVALPRTYVKANEQGTADQIAGQVSRMKNSSTIGVGTPAGPQSVDIGVLDSSGKGSDQFMAAVKWLDQCATNSVLAGFLDLSQTAASSSGYSPSGALSKDASDFFLQSEEARSREIAFSLRKYLFAPLIRQNFGPSSIVPKFEFEPLNAEDKSDAVEMLSNLMRSRDPALVPDEFIGELAAVVADYMGLDGDKTRASFDQAAKAAKEAAAKQSALMASQMGQQVAGTAGAIGAAGQAIKAAKLPKPQAIKQPRPPSVTGINTPQLPRAF